MKTPRPPEPDLITEFLILPDGRVFTQNLTPAMAALLLELNPEEPAMKQRVQSCRTPKNELSN